MSFVPVRRSAIDVVSVLILALMGSQFMTASSVPPIHNISTDTENPPEFDKVVALREAAGANPHAYDAAELADKQRQAYPQVQPLISIRSPQRWASASSLRRHRALRNALS